VEQKGLFKKGFTPSGEDPAYWPIPLLNEINDYIVNREYLKNSSGLGVWGVPPAVIAERYTPMKEAIRKVKTAYEILGRVCKGRLTPWEPGAKACRDKVPFDG
jgi:hypothetical protein